MISNNPRPVHAVASSGGLACDSVELIFTRTAARLPLPAAMARREAGESLLVAHSGQVAVVATPALGVFLSRNAGQQLRAHRRQSRRE